MGHAACFNGHSMWDGDFKPCVWIFEVQFFIEYMERHPGFLLNHPDEDYSCALSLYDCFDEVPGSEPDGWYCDECGCLAVFFDDRRIDYAPITDISGIRFESISDWEDYVACNQAEWEEFDDFYTDMSPVDALNTFPFKTRYKKSPDGMYVYGYNAKKEIVNGFKRVRFLELKRE